MTGPISSRSSDDKLVETILNELHVTATIFSLRRLKSRQSTQPAPLLVIFASTSGCSNIINLAKNLRTTSTPEFKNVYINPDLTHSQRLEQKQLNNERKTRKNNCEDVIIHRGKVIPRSARR